MKPYERLSLQQLDARLLPLKGLITTAQPALGWINAIRTSLCLSTYHLAKILNIRQPSVMALEKRERQGTVTLESLKKVAEALGCDVVYAFVPKTSLEGFVTDHSKQHVDQLLEKSHLTMSLEKQGLDSQALEQQRGLMLEEIQSKPLGALWREYDFSVS